MTTGMALSRPRLSTHSKLARMKMWQRLQLICHSQENRSGLASSCARAERRRWISAPHTQCVPGASGTKVARTFFKVCTHLPPPLLPRFFLLNADRSKIVICMRFPGISLGEIVKVSSSMNTFACFFFLVQRLLCHESEQYWAGIDCYQYASTCGRGRQKANVYTALFFYLSSTCYDLGAHAHGQTDCTECMSNNVQSSAFISSRIIFVLPRNFRAKQWLHHQLSFFIRFRPCLSVFLCLCLSVCLSVRQFSG